MKVLLLQLVPKSLISSLISLLSTLPIPKSLRHSIYGFYSRIYGVNIEDSLKPLSDFNTFQDFFTRKLKEGIRPISESSLVVPVDGKCTQSGTLNKNELIQAKGFSYSVEELFNKSKLTDYFSDLDPYWTFYLAPGDYHRIHSPVTGTILSRLYVPGELFPVNDWTRSVLPKLYVRNERVITLIKADYGGYVAVVKVGALNVGSVQTTYESNFISRSRLYNPLSQERYKEFSSGIPVRAGEELGLFRLGSTVIVIANKSDNTPIEFGNGARIVLGESLVK